MKFAVRLGVLGVAFVVMFSIVGLRLWFIQAAQGPSIALAADTQNWLTRSAQAPRGDIVDRNGTLLVTSRMVPSVWIDRMFVEATQSEALLKDLSAILSLPHAEVEALYEKAGINARFQVAKVTDDIAFMINERLDSLPGVEIVMVPERVYLSGPTLSHVIGYTGLPGQADIDANEDLELNVRIGRSGVESSYEADLKGTSGKLEYRTVRGEIVEQRGRVEPVQGDSVMLTIDLELQQVVEQVLQEGIELSNTLKEVDRDDGKEVFDTAERAAAVVLDAQTFEILASVSIPSYDPQRFERPLTQDEYDELEATLTNRVIGGAYPPASTFKAITYSAIEEKNLPLPANRDDVDLESRQVNCDGVLELPELADGSQQVKHDWYYQKQAPFGWLDLHGALANSCNIYFWLAGLGTFYEFDGGPRETILQDWAGDLGYGSATGIDLGGEAAGLIPTRAEFERRAEIQLENPGAGLLHPDRLLAGNSLWNGGDLMDFAIGQGAFTATPLQVAVSYAAMVNGGTVREPRVVDKIIRRDGNATEVTGAVVRTIPISEDTRLGLLADLGRVVSEGTARGAFANFGPGVERVGGKTGTAEVSETSDDHAWFVGVAPIDDPKYVVVVLIENGGSGGRVAAPVASHILQYLMGNEPQAIVAGQDTD